MDTDQPPPGITAADWAATPPAVRVFVQGCMQTIQALQPLVQLQQQQLVLLQQENAELRRRVADLEARLNQHSQNSSKPPSSDPPSAPRPSRQKSERKPGGQPGHPPHDRPDPPPDQIDQVRDHYPTVCPCCTASVAHLTYDACLPTIQYVWEIPIVRPLVTAHHYHTVCCRGCGALVTAPRPPDVPPGAFSPRTAAIVSMLRGEYHLSDRAIPRLLADFFEFPISLGSVVSLQAHSSAALERVHTDVHQAVQQTDRSNLDETSWKEAGRPRWLWTMVTAIATFFLITRSRSGPALRAILGERYGGIVGSDRHKPYLKLPAERHQFCWSHLKRNFQALADRGGRLGAWGADFLEITRMVFRLWHLYRGGTLDRAQLQEAMVPIQAAMHLLLVQGARRCDAPEGMCQELLTHEEALWTFVREEGVEPTNNAAEQALRPAVLWRKGCFGAHSDAGNRFVERFLTVSATCRQHERHLLTFLTEAIEAYWAGRPAPTLIPTAASSPQ